MATVSSSTKRVQPQDFTRPLAKRRKCFWEPEPTPLQQAKNLEKLGTCDLKCGNIAEGLKKLAQANRVAPMHSQIKAVILYQIGFVHLHQKKYTSALQHLEEALRIPLQNTTLKVKVLSNLALANGHTHKLRKGIALLKRAVQVKGAGSRTIAIAKLNLGIYYCRSKDPINYERAISEFTSALELDYEDDPLRHKLSQNLKKALELARPHRRIRAASSSVWAGKKVSRLSAPTRYPKT